MGNNERTKVLEISRIKHIGIDITGMSWYYARVFVPKQMRILVSPTGRPSSVSVRELKKLWATPTEEVLKVEALQLFSGVGLLILAALFTRDTLDANESIQQGFRRGVTTALTALVAIVLLGQVEASTWHIVGVTLRIATFVALCVAWTWVVFTAIMDSTDHWSAGVCMAAAGICGSGALMLFNAASLWLVGTAVIFATLGFGATINRAVEQLPERFVLIAQIALLGLAFGGIWWTGGNAVRLFSSPPQRVALRPVVKPTTSTAPQPKVASTPEPDVPDQKAVSSYEDDRRALVSDLRSSWPADQSLKGFTFFVDPGHGETESGANREETLRNGRQITAHEANHTWDIAVRVKWYLVQRGATVYFTVENPADPSCSQEGYWHPQQPPAPFSDLKLLADPAPGTVGVNTRALSARPQVVLKRIKPADYPRAVFVSFHYDIAPAKVSGTTVWCWPGQRPAVVDHLYAAIKRNGRVQRQEGKIGEHKTVRQNVFAVINPEYNPLEQRLLIEVANIVNDGDFYRMRDPFIREKSAKTFAEGFVSWAETVSTR